MAQHLVVLVLNDEFEDIQSEDELFDFVRELRGCIHTDLWAASVVYDLGLSVEKED